MSASRVCTPGLVVVDRDGVINRDRSDFVKSVDEWQPLPGSLEALALLTQAGFTIAVASNQSGLGRGLFDLATLEAIHEKMRNSVEDFGGRIELVAYCPHRPDENCLCRKPLPGLMLTIADELSLPLAHAPCIGDSERDIVAATEAGARPILVLTGNGEQTRSLLDGTQSIEVFPDLLAAARALVGEVGASC
jgi:D-glycero-D-manno-heptose 1,7-bisphosphate phosphatase